MHHYAYSKEEANHQEVHDAVSPIRFVPLTKLRADYLAALEDRIKQMETAIDSARVAASLMNVTAL